MPLMASNSALNLNLQTLAISGQVTWNGAMPVDAACSSSNGYVGFTDDRGTLINADIQCATHGFSTALTPGTYRVVIHSTGSSWNVPNGHFGFAEALTFQ